MRFAIVLILAPLAFADDKPVKVTQIYEYADGRKVVIEESSIIPVTAVKKAAGCPTCGPACSCGANCQCDSASWVATCTAVPMEKRIKVAAAAPVAVTAPPVVYTLPTYTGYRGAFDVPQYTTGAQPVRVVPVREPLLPGRRQAFYSGAAVGAACAGGT